MFKKAIKLHKQFGHPSLQKLVDLVRKAGIQNEELEKQLRIASEKCLTCVKFKKPQPRPRVSLPLATSFNETLALDLKSFGNVYFLVLVDIATRYCSAAVIRNKFPRTVVKQLCLSWIAHFGAPKRILSDNGGEFNNSELRELCERYNIYLMTTAPESPWSNGICERLNSVLS